MIHVRKADNGDLEFIQELVSRENRSGSEIEANLECFLICESGTERCGAGCARVSGDKGFINWVTVKIEYRRQKLGSAIMKALLNIMDLRGVKEAYVLSVSEEFLLNLEFYRTEEELSQDYEKFFGAPAKGNLYKVSLDGYFRTCSQK